jgi:hypothetical protein
MSIRSVALRENLSEVNFCRSCLKCATVAEYKVELRLCLIKHHAMNTYEMEELYLRAPLSSELYETEWLVSRFGSP